MDNSTTEHGTLQDYMAYRRQAPIIGRDLFEYAIHCEIRGKPLDARFVGLSLDLIALHLSGKVNMVNIPDSRNISPGIVYMGRFISYN